MRTIVTGGDDYEILATVSRLGGAAFRRRGARGRRAGDPHRRASSTARARRWCVDAGGKPIRLDGTGHTHF